MPAAKDANQNGIELLPGERLDALGRDGLLIIQNPGLFSFTTDAYLLAAYARPAPAQTVLELGSGSGAVLILLAARTPASRLVGLEIQPLLAEMAARNLALNGLAARAEVLCLDLREPRALEPAAFDLVVANPPYIPAAAGRLSPAGPKAIAKHELLCDLTDVARAAARWLKGGGRFVMVHRPSRLPEILAALPAARLTPKHLTLVYPRAGEEAGAVLIESRAGARPGLSVGPPLIIRGAADAFMPEMEAVFAGRWPWE